MKKKLTNNELVDRVYEVNEKTPTKEIENLMLIVHNRIRADDKPPKVYMSRLHLTDSESSPGLRR